MNNYQRVLPLFVSLLLCLPAESHANSKQAFSKQEVSKKALSRVVVQANTDWVYHGISENQSEPSLGVMLDRAWPSGLSVGVEAHRAMTGSPRERQRGASYFVAFDRAIADGQLISANASYRTFPGDKLDWEFWQTSISWQGTSGLRVQIDYSPEYYGRDTHSTALEISYSNNLSNRLYYKVGGGALKLSDGPDHQYGHVGIGYTIGSLSAELLYHEVWESNDSFFADRFQAPEFVFSLSFQAF